MMLLKGFLSPVLGQKNRTSWSYSIFEVDGGLELTNLGKKSALNNPGVKLIHTCVALN